jgi:malonyl-CoA/methylmalonyl-CoA synthetase
LFQIGPTVFQEYWNKEEATKKEFDENGFFKTGDVASVDSEGRFSILGRASLGKQTNKQTNVYIRQFVLDIIKCGGYKISALEIERIMLDVFSKEIQEIGVVGIKD